MKLNVVFLTWFLCVFLGQNVTHYNSHVSEK